MAGNDFVQVQLTEFGVKFAAGGSLTISNGRRSHTFKPGESTRVELSYEWNGWLAHYHSPMGELLFELAPAAAPLKPAAAPPPVPAENDSAAPEKETT